MRIALISIIMMLLLSSCASVNTHQQQCEQQYSKFSQIVSCLHQKFRTQPTNQLSQPGIMAIRASGDPDLVRLYLAAADKLNEEVKKGKMSDADAKLWLATIYAKLQSASSQRDQQALGNFFMFQALQEQQKPQPAYPKQAHCYWLGSQQYCNYY